MFGVRTFVAPYTPNRSARSVSIVTIRTLEAAAGGGAEAGARPQAVSNITATQTNGVFAVMSADRTRNRADPRYSAYSAQAAAPIVRVIRVLRGGFW